MTNVTPPGETRTVPPVVDDEEPAATVPVATTDAARRRLRRASREPMAVSLRATGGVYDVHTASDNVYRVDIAAETCSCPDWQAREQPCKHLYRVRLELQQRTVPTPDGQLPGQRVARDGDSRAPRQPLSGVATDPVGSKGRDETADESEAASTITGPHLELDPHGQPTDTTYYRCEACGIESIRRGDLTEHDCERTRDAHS
jgi:hypothetical protein